MRMVVLHLLMPTCAICVGLSVLFKIKRQANIRNRYNRVPNLTRKTIWESDITQENIKHKRVNRSALSQQMIARQNSITKTNIAHRSQKGSTKMQ